MRLTALLALIAVLAITYGCRFAGTPKEEILRHGGNIQKLDGGGSSVTLTGPRVSDDHLLAVTALGSNHSEYQPVRILDISGSKVTDAGLDRLATLSSLRELNVSGTGVTDSGVQLFSKRLPDCRVIRR